MVIDRKKFAKAEQRQKVARKEALYILRVILGALILVGVGVIVYINLQ